MSTNSSTALITGGTSGIGRAVANKLAALGIHVIVVGRNVERGKKTVAEIRAAGGKADFISSDLRGAESARELARKAIELGNGHVDILINNAGIYPFGPTHEMTEEMFEHAYALNVKAPYFLVAELAPLMAVAAPFEIAVVKNSLGRNLERKINFHAISKEGASIMA